MSTRDDILSAVRQSLHRSGALDPSVRSALGARLGAPPVHIKPALRKPVVERFTEQLSAAAGTVSSAASDDDVPALVEDYLDRNSLDGGTVVISPDQRVDRFQWPPHLAIARRAAEPGDAISITPAFAAVAETGSVVLVSHAQTPTSLNLLPETHIVIVDRDSIVAHAEDVWARIRQQLPGMPRTVNFITGPSRTADVEQTLQLGAHGPRRFHVIIRG